MSINTFSSDMSCLYRGIGIAIVVEKQKPRLIINIKNIKTEGSDYHGKFLSLCKKVD